MRSVLVASVRPLAAVSSRLLGGRALSTSGGTALTAASSRLLPGGRLLSTSAGGDGATHSGRHDAFLLLGLFPGASKQELKKAFHRQSWLYHPDRYPSTHRKFAEEQFKALSQAYRVALGGEPRRGWPFNGRGSRRSRQVDRHTHYRSIFSEFWGVRRREHEETLAHVLRAALCYRWAPTDMCERGF